MSNSIIKHFLDLIEDTVEDAIRENFRVAHNTRFDEYCVIELANADNDSEAYYAIIDKDESAAVVRPGAAPLRVNQILDTRKTIAEASQRIVEQIQLDLLDIRNQTVVDDNLIDYFEKYMDSIIWHDNSVRKYTEWGDLNIEVVGFDNLQECPTAYCAPLRDGTTLIKINVWDSVSQALELYFSDNSAGDHDYKAFESALKKSFEGTFYHEFNHMLRLNLSGSTSLANEINNHELVRNNHAFANMITDIAINSHLAKTLDWYGSMYLNHLIPLKIHMNFANQKLTKPEFALKGNNYFKGIILYYLLNGVSPLTSKQCKVTYKGCDPSDLGRLFNNEDIILTLNVSLAWLDSTQVNNLDINVLDILYSIISKLGGLYTRQQQLEVLYMDDPQPGPGGQDSLPQNVDDDYKRGWNAGIEELERKKGVDLSDYKYQI